VDEIPCDRGSQQWKKVTTRNQLYSRPGADLLGEATNRTERSLKQRSDMAGILAWAKWMSSAAPCLQEPWTAAADSVRAATMTEEQRLSTANLDERASLLWRIIQDLRPPPHVGQRLPRTSRPLPPLPLPLRSSSILDQRTGTTNTNPSNFLMILEMCSRSRTALPSRARVSSSRL
jgi:hypothetical protein